MTKKDADIIPALSPQKCLRGLWSQIALSQFVPKLPRMNYQELVTLWAELFGTYCYSQGRDFLIRRITWRLRNELAGGLSERAQARAELICDEALIRLRPQRYKYQYNDPQSLTPQSVIQREYKGQVHEVIVLNKGRYSYQNEIYDNLTSVAWKIAGYKISGNKFFNLPAKPRLPKSLRTALLKSPAPSMPASPPTMGSSKNSTA